ncbi:MAG: calcium/sodium antiporter [Nanoarchaeota archaeon]|nr:calcium/sodium antiporter [Nanoarchaeota archaeon]
MVFVNFILLIVGLVLLVKGSDFFVESASSIAKRMGVSEFVIGLTLVALGTSVPELASSVVAAAKGAGDLAIGNVVGSNIANIGLILGIAAVIAVIKTKKQMLTRDGFLMLFATCLFYIFIIDGVFGWIEALLFLLLYVAYMTFLIKSKDKMEKEYHFGHFVRYFFRFGYIVTIRNGIQSSLKKKKIPSRKKAALKQKFRAGMLRDLALLFIGGVGIVFGARYLVEEAIFFANIFNLSNTVIGVILVAVGTSLPELSVSITAAKKGYGDICVGNVIGSNIANLFLILGVAGLITPLVVDITTLLFTGPVMILMAIMLLIFIRSRWKIRRTEGLILLTMYCLFISLLLFRIF